MENKREQIRRLLKRWAMVPMYCAKRQEEVAKLAALLDGAADIRPQVLDGMPRGSNTSDPTARNAETLGRLKEAYAQRIADLNEQVSQELRFAKEIDELVRDLEPKAQSVLYTRYRADVRSFQRVAELLNYSERQVKNIEAEAVDKLAEMIVIEKAQD